MDRRKRKSRKAIFDACVELIQEKEFENITINEIVVRADLNRGTFYLHFADKYDMMNSFENEMIEKIEHVIMTNLPEQQSEQLFIQSRYDTIIDVFKCFEENKEFLQLILKSSHNLSFQAKLRKKLKMIFKEEIFPKFNQLELNIPIDLIVMVFTSTILSVAEYAFQSETSIDSEKLAEFLINVLIQGPARTLGIIKQEEPFVFIK